MVKRSDVPVLEVLQAARRFHNPVLWRIAEVPTPEEALSDRFPPKVVLARMEQMVAQDLLEYGVSLRTAWPTDKGLALLREANGNQAK